MEVYEDQKNKKQRLYPANIKMNIVLLVLLSSMKNTKRRNDRKFTAANILIYIHCQL